MCLVISLVAALAFRQDDLAGRRQAFFALLNAQNEAMLALQPDVATLAGDGREAMRWPDLSPSGFTRRAAVESSFLDRLKTFSVEGFSPDEAQSRDLLMERIQVDLDGYRLGVYLNAVDPIQGPHLLAPTIARLSPLKTASDAEAYVVRLKRVPGLLNDFLALVNEGMRRGRPPAREMLVKVVAQCRRLGEDATPFVEPLNQLPEAIRRGDLVQISSSKALEAVQAAYRQTANALERLLPRARTEPGLGALPDGAAMYRWAIRRQTGAEMDPVEVERQGTAEVKRLETELDAISQKEGVPGRRAFWARQTAVPASREALLSAYRKQIEAVRGRLDRAFPRVTTSALEVRPAPVLSEGQDAVALYIPAGGARPAAVQVDTSDLGHRLLIKVRTLAFHEGVPGHHLQASSAGGDLPPFRRGLGPYAAFSEGWALYAEGLSSDLGLRESPAERFARLASELWRAARLVADVGVNTHHWSRNQAVEYLRAHTLESEATIQADADRTIAMPGQATAYTLGLLQIRSLRSKAAATLGPAFDVQAFHDEILRAGGMPLDALATRMDAWVIRQKG